jgi:hypothetical protein
MLRSSFKQLASAANAIDMSEAQRSKRLERFERLERLEQFFRTPKNVCPAPNEAILSNQLENREV